MDEVEVTVTIHVTTESPEYVAEWMAEAADQAVNAFGLNVTYIIT